MIRRTAVSATIGLAASLMLTVTGAGTTMAAIEDKTTTSNVEGATSGNPFQEQNGWFYHYVRANSFEFEGQQFDYPSTPFSDITTKVNNDFYTDRGVSNIMIYTPYKASADFRGIPAIDFFDAQVGTGTVQDFETMVSAAHAKGMTVTAYMGLFYVDHTNPLFEQAEVDRRDGVNSDEVNMFRWADEIPSQNPDDFPEFEGGWAWSETAQSYYITSWEYPALDYANQVTIDYGKSVLEFWLDTGLDGFEYDFPLSFLGMSTEDMTVVPPDMKDILVTTPTTYTSNPKWLHAEGAGQYYDEDWNDQVGFTHILINGDEDFWSFPIGVMSGGATGVDDLEAQYATYLDPRRANGQGVNSWSLYDYDLTGDQRALDAAVQAGMGSLYSIDHELIYTQLSASEKQKYNDVFRALTRSTALAPEASRTQRPAEECSGQGQASKQLYAIERTSTDGSETVLNIYNFRDTPVCVTVDLSNSDIVVPQTPVDLSTQQDGAPITSTSYDVQLPAYGYRFLDVATQ